MNGIRVRFRDSRGSEVHLRMPQAKDEVWACIPRMGDLIIDNNERRWEVLSTEWWSNNDVILRVVRRN